jgi:hypothetical protein
VRSSGGKSSLFLSSDGDQMHTPVEGKVDPGHNDQTKDILTSSDKQVGFLKIVQAIV